jgi:hypothetical protein
VRPISIIGHAPCGQLFLHTRRFSGPMDSRRVQDNPFVVGVLLWLLMPYFPKIARIAARPRLVMRGSLWSEASRIS